MSSRTQFKPKNPKARKGKTGTQKRAIAQRQKAEDSRTDAVAQQRRKSFAIQSDPRLFLTGGVKTQAYVDRKAQDDLADTFGSMAVEPKPELGGAFDNPRSDVPDEPDHRSGAVEDLGNQFAQLTLPPGVRVAPGRNPTSRVRQHNKDVKLAYKRTLGHKEEPVYPGNQLPDQDYAVLTRERDRIEREKREERKRVDLNDNRGGKQYLSQYEQLLARAPNPSTTAFAESMDAPFNPENPFAPGYTIGPEQSQRALDEVRAFEQNVDDFLTRGDMAYSGPLPREDVSIRLTPEELAEQKAKAMELLKRKKGAKTQEERDYYKRAIKDLKAPESQVRARQRGLDKQAEQSAPTTFTPQNPGINKYPGPANIEDGFVKVSMETSVEPIPAGAGGGMTGQTETFVAPAREYNKDFQGYQRFAQRKGQKLNALRLGEGGDLGFVGSINKPKKVVERGELMTDINKMRSSKSIPTSDEFFYDREDEDTDEEEIEDMMDAMALDSVANELPETTTSIAARGLFASQVYHREGREEQGRNPLRPEDPTTEREKRIRRTGATGSLYGGEVPLNVPKGLMDARASSNMMLDSTMSVITQGRGINANASRYFQGSGEDDFVPIPASSYAPDDDDKHKAKYEQWKKDPRRVD